ncbi:M48 family metalloprotease [Natronosalvus halobius]|uniref:M48 family metalloprotease n=1 Tax=Natronosalvus halobius TaxID=2953746 RepID=UPI00209DDD57|nr:M48 family metalloprotease [Natronosalvus halobius]USZ72863.1 M48 family metalloprotease [Natronosalvus halobius]
MASRDLLGRMATTLGAIVLANLVLALVFVTLLEPWLAPVFDGVGLSRGVAFALATALCLGCLLVVQLRYARLELLAEADARALVPDERPELTDRVTRLAAQLDVAVPAVAVADTQVANSFAVGSVRSGTIVVSEGLLETLDSAELDAVLAHELAHLKNRDAAVMTLASFLPALIADEHVVFGDHLPRWTRSYVYGGLLFVAALLGSSFTDAPVFTLNGLLQLAVALAVTVVVGGIVLGVVATAVVFLSRSLSRQREFVADRAGALTTGDPATLAGVLERLDGHSNAPVEDARNDAEATSGGHYRGLEGMCLLPHGFDRSREGATDGGDPLQVDTYAHPSTIERIARLRTLAAELERAPYAE